MRALRKRWKNKGNAKASKFKIDESFSLDHGLKSDFYGYQDLDTESEVIGVFGKDGSDKLQEGEIGYILDKTPFYAESGGQVGDQGSFSSESINFEVLDTQFSGDAILILEPSPRVKSRLEIKLKLP